MSLIFSPRTTPIERSTMKGLLRPKLDLHLSDNDPKIGVRKKPMSGDKHQISVMCSWRTPETKEIISSHLNMNRLFFQMLLLLDGRVVGGNISSIGPQNIHIKVFFNSPIYTWWLEKDPRKSCHLGKLHLGRSPAILMFWLLMISLFCEI